MIKAVISKITDGYEFSRFFNSRLLRLLRNQLVSDRFSSLILGYGYGNDIELSALGQSNILLDKDLIDDPRLKNFKNKTFIPLLFDLVGGGIGQISANFQNDIKVPAIPLADQSLEFIYSSLNMTVNTPVQYSDQFFSDEMEDALYFIQYAILVQQIADIARLLKPKGYFSVAYHSHLGPKNDLSKQSDYFVPNVSQAKNIMNILRKGDQAVDASLFLGDIFLGSGYFEKLNDLWIKAAENKILIKDYADGSGNRIWLIRHKAFKRTNKTFNKKDFEDLDEQIYQKIFNILKTN